MEREESEILIPEYLDVVGNRFLSEKKKNRDKIGILSGRTKPKWSPSSTVVLRSPPLDLPLVSIVDVHSVPSFSNFPHISSSNGDTR